MDTNRFDSLTRTAAHRFTRRGLAGGLGLVALGLPGVLEAKKKRKRKNKKKKIERNSFGCVDIGKFCKNGGQCCSGICEGKKDKKRCQAHDTGGCQAGDDICADTGNETCQEDGSCFRTTGNASFCGNLGDGECAACAKDADCEAAFGPGAACVVCTPCDETGGTRCSPPAALG